MRTFSGIAPTVVASAPTPVSPTPTPTPTPTPVTPGTGPTGTILWKPDYSGGVVATGTHSNVNPGVGSGESWKADQEPWRRGVKQQGKTILAGSAIPGQVSDGYRPTDYAMSVVINSATTPYDYPLTLMQAMPDVSSNQTFWFSVLDHMQTSGDGYLGLQYHDQGDTTSGEAYVDPTTRAPFGLSGVWGPSNTPIQQGGGVTYMASPGEHQLLLNPVGFYQYGGSIAAGALSTITGVAPTALSPIQQMPVVGDCVVGNANIQAGTTVTSVSGSTVGISKPATGAVSNLTFGGNAQQPTNIIFNGVAWSQEDPTTKNIYPVVNNTYQFTGTITSTISGMTTAQALATLNVTGGTTPAVGDVVFGNTNIPIGTTIVSISGTTATLSQPATAAITSANGKFSGGQQIYLPIYNADGSIKYAIGQSVPCWSVTAQRGFEGSLNALPQGTQINVICGDVFVNGPNWVNRSECFDRYPNTPATSTIAGAYPDPVGSIPVVRVERVRASELRLCERQPKL